MRGDKSQDAPLLPVSALSVTPSGSSSTIISANSCHNEATSADSVSNPGGGTDVDTIINDILPSSQHDSPQRFSESAGVSGSAENCASDCPDPRDESPSLASFYGTLKSINPSDSSVVFTQSGGDEDLNDLGSDLADTGFCRDPENRTTKQSTNVPEACSTAGQAQATDLLQASERKEPQFNKNTEQTTPSDGCAAVVGGDDSPDAAYCSRHTTVDVSTTDNVGSSCDVADACTSALASSSDDFEEQKQPLLATNPPTSKLSRSAVSTSKAIPTKEKGPLAPIKEDCAKEEEKSKLASVKEEKCEENSEHETQNPNRALTSVDDMATGREETDSAVNLIDDHEEDVDNDKDFEDDRHSDDDAEDEGEDDADDYDHKDEEEEDNTLILHKGNDIDRGFAWVVLVFAFIGMTLFGTFTFSTGIFQAEILQVLEPDVRKTSWVGAVHYSTICLMGPFAGLIKHKLGSRMTVVMSSIVICLGMIGASFSTNVTQLIVTYGIITGMGTGTALNPMFVCVSYYFERYRGFTSGIIAAGAGAGMFVGGPSIRYLIETYSLSGAYLIWGAVGLNIGVVGMLMRPSSLERAKERAECETTVYYDQTVGPGLDPMLVASLTTLPSAGGYWGSVLGASSILVKMDTVEADPPTLQQSQILLEVPDLQNAIRSNTELSAVNSPELLEAIGRPMWRPPTRNFRSSQHSMGDGNSCNEFTLQEVVETSARTDWRPRNVLSSQLSMGESVDSYGSERPRLNPLSSRARAGLGLLKAGSRQTARKGSLMPPRSRFPLCQALETALDSFRFVRNPGFALYLFSGSLWVLGESIVFLYLPTYAAAKGSTAFQGATLITALGLTNTLSRLVAGFVAGDASVGPDVLHVGLLGLCGLFTATFPLYADTYSGQVAFSLLYGIYSGGLASVINLLIISFIGVEFVSLAFGIICFGQGVASLLGPPIAGAIVGSNNNYDDVFVFAGILLTAAGCLGFPMVIFKPRAPEMDTDVEKAGGETTRSIRVRMKGESCHT